VTNEELQAWEKKLRESPGEYAILNPDDSMELLPTQAILTLIHEVQDSRSYGKLVQDAVIELVKKTTGGQII